MKYFFEMLENECWWGGTATDGIHAPFDKNTEIEHDFRVQAMNQTMPMYLSDMGRCIWSEEAFYVKIADGRFEIEGSHVTLEQFGTTLREAYLGAMHNHFPPSGNPLPEEFFKVPQYNTWMQMMRNQTQEKVLNYAKEIVANGFTPGILMLDEGWQKDYGEWDFDRLKFPEPKKMIEELHRMGFTVMVWVTPNVRADGENFVRHFFREFNPAFHDKIFLRTTRGKVALCVWWNGFSAILDLTKQCDCDYLDEQLQHLMTEYGVDGFKFDGGTVAMYSEKACKNGMPQSNYTAVERNIAWNEFGRKYPYHEYKDTFKGGGKRVIQRICDREHRWGDTGLRSLIPHAILQGLLGHPFICPDMIGGGEWLDRALGVPADEELFVRMAQCAALFPMMQFSWAPWDAVDAEHLQYVKAAEELHIQFADKILALVEQAYEAGEPILRALEYNYPHMDYREVKDVFMLGEDILVAPIIEQGQRFREIPLPPGMWKGVDGKTYVGATTVSLPVSLGDLPYFLRETEK